MKTKTKRQTKNKLYTLTALLCFLTFSLIAAFMPQSLIAFAGEESPYFCKTLCPYHDPNPCYDSSHHGLGRENGYNANYLTEGCRNWKANEQDNPNSVGKYTYNEAFPLVNANSNSVDPYNSLDTYITAYGPLYNSIIYDPDVINIPYWINESTFQYNVSGKPYSDKHASPWDIYQQAMAWNSVRVYDDLGAAKQIVNLVRVESKIHPISGLTGTHICEIIYTDISLDPELYGYGYYLSGVEGLRQDTTNGVGGLFSAAYLTIKLHLGGHDPYTPMHEFGHLLGLGDLDDLNGPMAIGSHKNVLMGYGRSSNVAPIQMQYPDIQGVLYQNSGTHDCQQHLERYVEYDTGNGTQYLYFCFYCDMMHSFSSAAYGGEPMQPALGCEHEWQELVSFVPTGGITETCWHKCTKCYKVADTFYNVGFDPDNGENPYVLSLAKGDIIITTMPEKQNHTFLHWAILTDPAEQPYAGPVDADISLISIWRINTYSVSFNLDGLNI